MQLFPLLKFYLRNETAINALLNQAASGDSPAVLELVNVAAPLLKKWFPAQAALIDDALATLKDVTGPVSATLESPNIGA